jgi:hypothetical protein
MEGPFWVARSGELKDKGLSYLMRDEIVKDIIDEFSIWT